MKQVLLVLESSLLREYIRLKLEENGVDVAVAISPLDGISKMRSLIPDLVILDYLQDHQTFLDLLRSKKADPNTVNTPVVIFAQNIEQKQLLELVPYNVKKVFSKPLKIDALFAALSAILGVPFALDASSGIMEVHVNEGIIFIEIAQGLNMDKLDLLRFKLSELIELYKIRIPKVIILLSDIKLSLGDSPGLRKLMRIVLEASRARPRYIRILTNDEFVRQFINGVEEYSGVIVTSNFQNAMSGFLTEVSGNIEEAGEKAELIGSMILKAAPMADGEDVVFEFDAEARKISFENMKDLLQNLRIAVVDDDLVIQEMIKNTFKVTNAFVYTFNDGREFLDIVDGQEFDLVFLDINMPRVEGFEVLGALQARRIRYPVIILSVVSERDAMIRAIQMGVSGYLVKPIKPEDIFMKSIEILKANF